MDNKERFLEICSCIKRDGIDTLIKWLSETDFYTCPGPM